MTDRLQSWSAWHFWNHKIIFAHSTHSSLDLPPQLKETLLGQSNERFHRPHYCAKIFYALPSDVFVFIYPAVWTLNNSHNLLSKTFIPSLCLTSGELNMSATAHTREATVCGNGFLISCLMYYKIWLIVN